MHFRLDFNFPFSKLGSAEKVSPFTLKFAVLMPAQEIAFPKLMALTSSDEPRSPTHLLRLDKAIEELTSIQGTPIFQLPLRYLLNSLRYLKTTQSWPKTSGDCLHIRSDGPKKSS
jgi:hypothetical protein